jgi:N-acetylneuraminic acid mutarotase
MNRRVVLFFPIALSLFLLAADQPKIPAMPGAVTSNAVASLKGGLEVYSLMGLGTKKTWDDVTNKVYQLRMRSGKWVEGPPVPGVAGRLGASAIGAKGQIFLFGGYAYLVGGRSKNGPVNIVQVYDAEKNTWSQATAVPGTPVFGHAGGITDDTIVYVDGAKKDPGNNKYVASDECWMGKIDHKDPNKIEWSKLPAHPGPGRFGIIAGAADHKVLFSGGTLVPHNFKGLDADGKQAEISSATFVYELHGSRWETIAEDTYDVRSDSRGILFTPLGPLILGGTLKNSAISARVLVLPKK